MAGTELQPLGQKRGSKAVVTQVAAPAGRRRKMDTAAAQAADITAADSEVVVVENREKHNRQGHWALDEAKTVRVCLLLTCITAVLLKVQLTKLLMTQLSNTACAVCQGRFHCFS